MPIPRKKKYERKKHYIQRLIRHYIDEGYPQKQAVAIAINVAEKEYSKVKIQIFIPFLPIIV